MKTIFLDRLFIVLGSMLITNITWAKEAELSSSKEVPTPSVMFRQDEMRRGQVRVPFPQHQPQLRWIYKTGGPIVSSPSVDSQGNIFVGSLDGYLYSLSESG